MCFFSRLSLIFGLALALLSTAAGQGNPRPVVGPGATKDDVINAYGWPNGQSQSGAKEILSYAQGEVVLENGRVERVNFSPDVPWQAPKPRRAPPTASTRKIPEAPIDYWMTDFELALKEAQRRRSRVLALFTGSDWSPASLRFKEEVEYHPDFVNAFAGDFVFLKLDFPRGNPVPAQISEEKLRLRERFRVTTYPSLLVLSATGELLARADLTTATPGEDFRSRVIAAVREARAGAGDGAGTTTPSTFESAPSAPTPAPAAGASPAGPTEPAAPPARSPARAANPAPSQRASNQNVAEPSAATPVLLRAGTLLGAALLIGAGAALFFLWRLWRQPQPTVNVGAIATRIDAIAGGMPTSAEMMSWSKEKLSAVMAALTESDGYDAQRRPAGDDVDLALRKRGDIAPRVLVACWPGENGPVTLKRLRELFASLAAEGVETGWVVAPAGFGPEARDYAAAHRIVLLNIDGVHNMMREVPPVSLPGILAQGEDTSSAG